MPGAAAMPRYIQEAERLGHNGIGCEHLLLGVLADEDGVAAKVLAAHGVELDATRRRVAEMIGDGWQDSVRWSSSPRATIVRRLAEVEAERLEQLPSNDAHLLLAMITEGGGVPMHVLAELNVDVGQLREDLLTALNVHEDLRGLYLRQRHGYEHTQQKARAKAQDLDEQARPPT
ncbi:MAG TPA: Clp protease N-terminal domain-containing protein [Solirubrobacteraceae bacterium]|nr:Clp protease N-terminal domain-containing protein [Solirubrobacteraceae bacterium]